MELMNTSHLVIMAIAVIVSLSLAIYFFIRPSLVVRRTLILLMLATAEWGLCAFFESSIPIYQQKILWSKISYFGIATVPVLWFIFCAEFTQWVYWRDWKWKATLFIIPLIILLLTLTNELHNLIWVYISPVVTDSGFWLNYDHGAGFWVHAVYSYFLLLAGALLLFIFARKSSGIFRKQVAIIIVSAFIPWIGNALYLFDLNPWPGLDLTPLSFSITGLLIAWGLSSFQMFNLAPIARDALIERISDGIIVINKDTFVVDINPAACRMLGCSGPKAVGKPLIESMKSWEEYINRFKREEFVDEELLFNNQTWIHIRISPLVDNKKSLIGKLIVIQDITNRKKAETELGTQRDFFPRQ